MLRPPLVTEPEAITAQWLTAALSQDASSGTVNAISYEPVGAGLMARSYRFTLDGDQATPASVVIKLPSAEAHTRELGASSYRRELGFYADLAPHVSATIPACLYADHSDTGQEFVLVLEDITPARSGDQIAGCTTSDAIEAVENLARLHASTWSMDAIERYSWVDAATDVTLTDYLGLAFPIFEERFGSLLTGTTMDVIGRYVAGADAWLDVEPTSRAAVHGDYRLDNLLYSTVDGAVTVVDWQTVSYGCPGRDLAYFVGNAMEPERRREVEGALIVAYIDELTLNGVQNYGADECRSDMVHGSLQAPLLTVLGAFTAIRTPRSDTMFTAMAERSAQQILDYNALDLLT